MLKQTKHGGAKGITCGQIWKRGENTIIQCSSCKKYVHDTNNNKLYSLLNNTQYKLYIDFNNTIIILIILIIMAKSIM